jgi:hypothetical protein
MTNGAPTRSPARAAPLSYLPLEVESVLPSGWILAPQSAGWDAPRGVWRQPVLDPARVERELLVPAADAKRLGRLPALRRVIDRLYRNALA